MVEKIQMDEITLFTNLSNLLLTLFAFWVTSSWESLLSEIPAARFVMHDMATVSIPTKFAKIAS